MQASLQYAMRPLFARRAGYNSGGQNSAVPQELAHRNAVVMDGKTSKKREGVAMKACKADGFSWIRVVSGVLGDSRHATAAVHAEYEWEMPDAAVAERHKVRYGGFLHVP